MRGVQRFCFIFLFLLGIKGPFEKAVSLYAEITPTWTQAMSFGGVGSDQGNAVKVDNLGDRYVTGGSLRR